MEDNCPICLEQLKDNWCLNEICLTCRKIMCKDCLSVDGEKLAKCPHCRDYFIKDTEDDIERANKILEKFPKFPHKGVIYFNLSVLYSENEDTENCKKYLKMSAEEGMGCAYNTLSCDCKGEEAKYYLDKAVERGCISAYYTKYKDEYEKGNNDVAKVLLCQAAEGGLPLAMKDLGICYFNGSLFKKDVEKGIRFLEGAAEKGNTEANFELSNIYYNGTSDIEIDKEKAIAFATVAAKQGHELATMNLATECYYTGLYYECCKWLKPYTNNAAKVMTAKCYIEMAEVLGDFVLKEGLDIITKLSEEEVPSAIYELGLIHLKGNSIVEQDDVKAFTLIKHAADKLYIPSYNKLAQMYLNGIGTEKNIQAGTRYSLGYIFGFDIDDMVVGDPIVIEGAVLN